jgi:hypothetical protein
MAHNKRHRAKYKDRKYGISLSLSGEQKNELIDYADEIGVSLNALIVYAALMFVRDQRGIASPGPSQFAKASLDDVLTAYVRGERLLQPCGKQECDQVPTEISGMEFCKTCNLRIG